MELTLPDDSHVQAVLDHLHVAPEIEAFVAVNGVVVHDNPQLHDGDEVALIPAIAGGQASSISAEKFC